MPPYDPAAMAALQGLQSNLPNNPTAQLYLSRNREKQQLLDSISQAQRRGDPAAVAGLRTSLGGVEEGIEESPLTAQAGEVADYEGQLRAAIGQGFGANTTNNPRGIDPIQARSLAGQASADEKMRMPLQEQTLQNQGNLAVTQQQGKNALDVGRMSQETATMKSEAQLEALSKMLNGGLTPGSPNASAPGSPGGLPPGSTVNLSGVGSIHTPTTPQIPVGLQQTVTTAKRNLEAAGIHDPFLNDDTTNPNQAAFNQAIGNVIAASPARQSVKEAAIFILKHPTGHSLPFDQLIDANGTDPGEAQELSNLLLQIRGF